MNLLRKIRQSSWIILSLLLHAIIILLFILTYAQQFPSAGQQHVKVKHAYVYQHTLEQQHKYGNNKQAQVQSQQQKPKAVIHQQKPQQKKSQQPQHTVKAQTQAKPQQHSQAASGQALTQGLSKFLIVLHNQIQQHQTYPQVDNPQALANSVRVTFKIYPDGRIRQINIAKSSGYQALDQAALQAVRDISPVKQARKYLKQPQWMAVKISFL